MFISYLTRGLPIDAYKAITLDVRDDPGHLSCWWQLECEEEASGGPRTYVSGCFLDYKCQNNED